MNKIDKNGLINLEKIRNGQNVDFHFEGNLGFELDTPTELHGDLQLYKHFKQDAHSQSFPWHEFYTLEGQLSAKAQLTCVRCLDLIPTPFELDLHCFFAPEKFQHHRDWESETTILFKNIEDDCESEFELFFLQKNQINFKELIEEYQQLNLSGLPLCKEDCLGLCQECGENKNHSTCTHNPGIV